MEIGAQFFTIREHCKNLNDFAESLAKVAEIGYKTVQISGVCPYEPQWLAQQLKKNGLRCVITHIARERLQQETEQVAKEHDVFDCRYIGLGSAPLTEEKLAEDYENLVKTYGPVAKTLKNCGKYFMYHNHKAEFQKLDGKTVMQKLSEDFPADEMGFTLDTYWVQTGGGDPAQWIQKLSGRVPCIHLKDYAYGAKMAVIGEGNINFDRVFQQAEAAGTQYMLVEQDNCNGEDPFDCLRRSYEYLHSCGF